MLVLTRKVGEKIVIGENITVEVLEIKNNRVRLGITAPSEVGIVRGELVVEVEVTGDIEIVEAEPDDTTPPVAGSKADKDAA